jgi:hypothetical protein
MFPFLGGWKVLTFSIPKNATFFVGVGKRQQFPSQKMALFLRLERVKPL